MPTAGLVKVLLLLLIGASSVSAEFDGALSTAIETVTEEAHWFAQYLWITCVNCPVGSEENCRKYGKGIVAFILSGICINVIGLTYGWLTGMDKKKKSTKRQIKQSSKPKTKGRVKVD